MTALEMPVSKTGTMTTYADRKPAMDTATHVSAQTMLTPLNHDWTCNATLMGASRLRPKLANDAPAIAIAGNEYNSMAKYVRVYHDMDRPLKSIT